MYAAEMVPADIETSAIYYFIAADSGGSAWLADFKHQCDIFVADSHYVHYRNHGVFTYYKLQR